jgi:hypothetical protein
VENFISQFIRLSTAFKYYKVYWLNDQERESPMKQNHSKW